MQEVSSDKTIAAHVYDYITKPKDQAESDAFRQQVVDEMRINNPSYAVDEAVNKQLMDSGLMPKLFLNEWRNINTDNDETISNAEALAAKNSSDPILRMLGTDLLANQIPGLYLDDETSIDKAQAINTAFNTYPERPTGSDVPELEASKGDTDPSKGDSDPSKAGCDATKVTDTPPVQNTPEEEKAATTAAALADLQNPNIKPEDKIKDIETLVKNGQTTATIKDTDGSSITVRLEVNPISEGNDKHFVHMFAVDPATGKETVMLRAISDGTNAYKEKDKHGNDVDFVGKKWMQFFPNSMFKV